MKSQVLAVLWLSLLSWGKLPLARRTGHLPDTTVCVRCVNNLNFHKIHVYLSFRFSTMLSQQASLLSLPNVLSAAKAAEQLSAH